MRPGSLGMCHLIRVARDDSGTVMMPERQNQYNSMTFNEREDISNLTEHLLLVYYWPIVR